jgi:hypothetical protein
MKKPPDAFFQVHPLSISEPKPAARANGTVQPGLIPAALMIGHHFSMSAF